MNELLFFCTLMVTFAMILTFYRVWGKTGIYAFIALSSVLVNIEVLKSVDIFGLPLTLGNVLYGSTFLCTDILSQFYGGKAARRGVAVGFVSMIAMVVLTQLSLAFVPNASDFASEHLHAIFSLVPRMTVASLLTFAVTNTFDTYLYEWIAQRTQRIWLRNNLSTMTSQCLDSFLFSVLAFAGMMDAKTIALLGLTTWMTKVIVALCDTPCIYWAGHIYNKHHKGKSIQM